MREVVVSKNHLKDTSLGSSIKKRALIPFVSLFLAVGSLSLQAQEVSEEDMSSTTNLSELVADNNTEDLISTNIVEGTESREENQEPSLDNEREEAIRAIIGENVFNQYKEYLAGEFVRDIEKVRIEQNPLDELIADTLNEPETKISSMNSCLHYAAGVLQMGLDSEKDWNLRYKYLEVYEVLMAHVFNLAVDTVAKDLQLLEKEEGLFLSLHNHRVNHYQRFLINYQMEREIDSVYFEALYNYAENYGGEYPKVLTDNFESLAKKALKMSKDPETSKEQRSIYNGFLLKLGLAIARADNYELGSGILKEVHDKSESLSVRAAMGLFLAFNGDFSKFESFAKLDKQGLCKILRNWTDNLRHTNDHEKMLIMLIGRTYGPNRIAGAILDENVLDRFCSDMLKLNEEQQIDDRNLFSFKIADYANALKKAEQHGISKPFNLQPETLINLTNHLESKRDPSNPRVLFAVSQYDKNKHVGGYKLALSAIDEMLEKGYNVDYSEFDSDGKSLRDSLLKPTIESSDLSNPVDIIAFVSHSNPNFMLANDVEKITDNGKLDLEELKEHFQSSVISGKDLPKLLPMKLYRALEDDGQVFMFGCYSGREDPFQSTVADVMTSLFPNASKFHFPTEALNYEKISLQFDKDTGLCTGFSGEGCPIKVVDNNKKVY